MWPTLGNDPADLATLHAERQRLWSEQDRSKSLHQTLVGLPVQAAPNTTLELPGPLTSDASPPSELAAALAQAQREIEGIRRLEQTLGDEETALAAAESQAQMMRVAVIIAAIMFLAGLVYRGLSMAGVFG